jgi:DNA repair exonuclease SbcCD nuclease subunit
MRFLHTADWQIGMRAAMLGGKGERVRAARLESARVVIECARREQVDFVLVAGDTFEHNGVERLKVREVAKILGDSGCPVYVIPGNHDPVTAGSVWEDAVWNQYPNLRILTRAEPVAAPSATLYPCPVSAIDSRDDPTAWIHAGGDGIAIGIAHGSIEHPLYGEQALPIARDAATERGLDYLALGHYHSTTRYGNGTARMAYSGTHESTGFKEPASGNVLIVEIPERGAAPRIQTVRTGCLQWLTFDRRIEKPGEIGDLVAKLENLPAPERTLVECTLEGLLFGSDHEALSRLQEIVEGRFLFGKPDASRLELDQNGPDWIEQVPEGYLRNAARELLAAADPCAATALREFSRLWQEVK